MPPLAIPPLVALAAFGAIAVGRWALREFHRVNGELDVLKARAGETVDRSRLPTLRRDPVSGEYRPK